MIWRLSVLNIRTQKQHRWISVAILIGMLCVISANAAEEKLVYKAGHASLKQWILSELPPAPDDNKMTEQRVALGKQLFFDARLSGTGQVTCASCHLPERGWSDGMPTAIRYHGTVMKVASPTIINIGYNKILMWDGRAPTMEKQAFGGQGEQADINAESKVSTDDVVKRIAAVKGYKRAFDAAYPGEGVTRETIAKAIASFERSVVSRESPFDRWVNGDAKAMSDRQVNGFKLFTGKAECSACHGAPNFTDNGFHNIALKSFGDPDHHPGRFKHKPLKLLDGAFKTPTLRDVAMTSPYFHDGSAKTLKDVVEHYARGGDVKTNRSPNMKDIKLNDSEKEDLVLFLEALSSPQKPFVYPVLPQN